MENGEFMDFNFFACDVQRPILSMGVLLGCGHSPVFKEHGSFLWMKNGKWLALHRHGNLFFLKVRKALIAPLTQ
eukprot:4103619-Prorocentrum_lima.AAC.1